MTRHLFTFFGTFLVGALIALTARTARHQPHAEAAAAIPADSSGHHATSPSAHSSVSASSTPVNTVCAICGMKVDPSLPTATYQGKTIGFGCRMCPPKFKADPDKYGPAYLRNAVLKP